MVPGFGEAEGLKDELKAVFIGLTVQSIPFLYDKSDQDMHFPSSQIWGQSWSIAGPSEHHPLGELGSQFEILPVVPELDASQKPCSGSHCRLSFLGAVV